MSLHVTRRLASQSRVSASPHLDLPSCNGPGASGLKKRHPESRSAFDLDRDLFVMASHAAPVPASLGSAAVDPAFWGELAADATSMGMGIQMHFSPTASSTTQESSQGGTPPAQTPRSETTPQNGRAGNGAQHAQPARTSVAVACVPCRSRHLKCDGGAVCSRCKADGVDCNYIKSRRGWKGKRKPKVGENGSPTGSAPGSCPWHLSRRLQVPCNI